MHVKIVKFAKNQLSRIQLDMQKIIKITKCRKGEVGGGGGGGGVRSKWAYVCIQPSSNIFCLMCTVKILKFGTPQTIAIIVLKIEKFDVIMH